MSITPWTSTDFLATYVDCLHLHVIVCVFIICFSMCHSNVQYYYVFHLIHPFWMFLMSTTLYKCSGTGTHTHIEKKIYVLNVQKSFSYAPTFIGHRKHRTTPHNYSLANHAATLPHIWMEYIPSLACTVAKVNFSKVKCFQYIKDTCPSLHVRKTCDVSQFSVMCSKLVFTKIGL